MLHRMLVLCLFLLATTGVHSVLPGFKGTVTENGLTYAKDVGISILEAKIKSIKIPDLQGEASAPVIGKVTYTVSDIVLSSVSIPTSTIVPQANNDLLVSASAISIAMTANWKYRENSWPHISGHGSADISISESTMTLGLGLGANAAGDVTCSAKAVSINLNKFDIKDHGGADWLYNLLLSLFKGNIKNTITSQVVSEATSLINNNLNKALQSIPMKQAVGTLGEVDYSLVAAPGIGTNFVTLPGKGLFYPPKNPTPPPFSPTVTLPDITDASVMAQFFMSDFVGNSLFYALYKSGELDYTIDNGNLPSNFPVKFNTNAFEFLVPALYFKYPGLNMSATFVPQQAPVLTIDEKASANVLVHYTASFFVIATNKTSIPVFKLGVSLNIEAQVLISGNTASAQIKTGDVAMSVLSSNIGNFTTGALQVVANTALTTVVIPEINTMLAKGTTIPIMDGVQLVNPKISSAKGYFILSSSIKYTPTTGMKHKVYGASIYSQN